VPVRVALASSISAQGAARALQRRFWREHDGAWECSCEFDAKGAPTMEVVRDVDVVDSSLYLVFSSSVTGIYGRAHAPWRIPGVNDAYSFTSL